MDKVILFLIAFIAIFLFYFIFVLRREKYLSKFFEGKEILYLKYRYKIDITDAIKKKLAYSVVLANCLIISLTFSIVITIIQSKNFIIYLLLSLILVIILTLVIYHIIGTIFRKKEKYV